MGEQRPAPWRYLDAVRQTLDCLEETQTAHIAEAARWCADSILEGGLVHLFGSGHSRMAVEEMYPRYGSFPGFHPIVELSLTNHHQVVGANGQPQAMFIESVEGLGRVILGNFALDPQRDLMLVISSGGTSPVSVEVALAAREQGLQVIAITSAAHSQRATAKHSSGRKLCDVADLVLDTCTPPGDAAVPIAGLETPVAPLSSIASLTIINMIKAGVAERLVAAGQMPPVLTSSVLVGDERSHALFTASYRDYRERTRRL